ncbi:cyclic nucleotide-binding domain-containing protein [Chryseobacterium sp. GMJ5]|uniref:Cyclic nucleotide-binding domain-containing protein n=1 Tax=Chryseobacterium gilvum TaxID=2976534 RepID=A0ABT2VVA0_9FLAO|nr:cyclic nucleotide-binding domain-containing protein [Chryseobacterium gilvum]MCU7613930.1 cyclic nucleotide-binding domain-containing protein [Chryseobacterium gilvum]
MNHELLIHFLRQYGEISDVEKKIIEHYFIPLKAKKKEVLIEKNAPCNKLFFVNSGFLRAFYINEKGKEITRMIAWENRFLTNLGSFKNFTENNETIDCIKDAELLYIKREDFDTVIHSSLNLKSIYADLLEEYNTASIKRFEVLSTYTIEQKLAHLKQDFPNLLKALNDGLLASFLGMNRETYVRNKNAL